MFLAALIFRTGGCELVPYTQEPRYTLVANRTYEINSYEPRLQVEVKSNKSKKVLLNKITHMQPQQSCLLMVPQFKFTATKVNISAEWIHSYYYHENYLFVQSNTVFKVMVTIDHVNFKGVNLLAVNETVKFYQGANNWVAMATSHTVYVYYIKQKELTQIMTGEIDCLQVSGSIVIACDRGKLIKYDVGLGKQLADEKCAQCVWVVGNKTYGYKWQGMSLFSAHLFGGRRFFQVVRENDVLLFETTLQEELIFIHSLPDLSQITQFGNNLLIVSSETIRVLTLGMHPKLPYPELGNYLNQHHIMALNPMFRPEHNREKYIAHDGFSLLAVVVTRTESILSCRFRQKGTYRVSMNLLQIPENQTNQNQIGSEYINFVIDYNASFIALQLQLFAVFFALIVLLAFLGFRSKSVNQRRQLLRTLKRKLKKYAPEYQPQKNDDDDNIPQQTQKQLHQL